MANLTSLNAKAGGNYWESVTSFVTFDASAGKKDKSAGVGSSSKPKAGEPQRTSQLLQNSAGKNTDKARMRQVRRAPPPPLRVF